MSTNKRLILASGSAIRAALLRNAGLDFEVVPARIDEDAVKEAMLGEGAPARDVADTLAELKARRVHEKNLDALVIGADQVLVCKGKLFSKAEDVPAMMEQLKILRGMPHELLSAVVVFEDGKPVWRKIGRVRLLMRDFSDEFLARYIKENEDSLRNTVGCYQLEDIGVQLFDRVEGDYFSVLGLPLLELLGFLRTRGVCET